MSLQDQIAAGFARLATAINACASQMRARDWSYYAIQGGSPVFVGMATQPVPGRVLAYTLGGVTRYRLVPTVYIRTEDAFYANFASGACTGLLARRNPS